MRLFFTDLQAGNFNATQPSVWLAQNDWNACAMRAPGPPFNELTGRLADAVPADNIELDFTSARLAALLEAQYRKRTLLFGTLVRSLANTSFNSNGAFDATKQPRMVVRFYRIPPGAAR